jgi:nucleotide-binding universal stress UspA family protein
LPFVATSKLPDDRRRYGQGSMTEKAPGVWRLRVFTGVDVLTVDALFGRTADYLFVSVVSLVPSSGWSAGWGVATPTAVTLPAISADGSLCQLSELELLALQAKRHAAEVAVRSPLSWADVAGDVGDPARCILAAAHAHRVDVIAVGACNRSWCRRLFRRSVTREIIRGSDVPVLVVR